MNVKYYFPRNKALTITQVYREAQHEGAEFFVHKETFYQMSNEMECGYIPVGPIELFVDGFFEQDIVNNAYKVLGYGTEDDEAEEAD